MSAEIIQFTSSQSDPIYELIKRHRAAYDAVNAGAEKDDELFEMTRILAEASPATLAGVIAIMRYRRELDSDNYDLFAMRHDGAPPDDITAWLAVIEQALEGIVRRAAG